MTKKDLKSNLLQAKRFNEDTWRMVNCCIFMEQVTVLSSDKKKALSKLRECTNYLRTLDHMCDTVIEELEKSTTDFSLVETYSKKIDHTLIQLKDLLEEYKSLHKKPVEKD